MSTLPALVPSQVVIASKPPPPHGVDTWPMVSGPALTTEMWLPGPAAAPWKRSIRLAPVSEMPPFALCAKTLLTRRMLVVEFWLMNVPACRCSAPLVAPAPSTAVMFPSSWMNESANSPSVLPEFHATLAFPFRVIEPLLVLVPAPAVVTCTLPSSSCAASVVSRMFEVPPVPLKMGPTLVPVPPVPEISMSVGSSSSVPAA
ncbi:MAG: hypothetical protein K0S48_1624, partial [Ramlibacter sp.]|nr:hypothetical protein [Ramlibacter sp.]